MKYLFINDSFTLKDGRNVSIIQIEEDKVNEFKIKKKDRLVTNDAEGFEILDFEWFYPSSIPIGYRSLAIITERWIRPNQNVRHSRTAEFEGWAW